MLSSLQLLIAASTRCTMMSIIGRNHILKRCAGFKMQALLQLLSRQMCGGKGTERVCGPPEGQAGCRVWILLKDGIVQYGHNCSVMQPRSLLFSMHGEIEDGSTSSYYSHLNLDFVLLLILSLAQYDVKICTNPLRMYNEANEFIHCDCARCDEMIASSESLSRLQ